MSRNYTDLIKDRSSSENKLSKKMKTTDVNILLNRVRLNKKKTFRKNIFITLLLGSLLCMITIFFII